MKKLNPFFAVVIFTLLHYFLFFGEVSGLNAALFSISIFTFLFLRDRKTPTLAQVVLIGGHFLGALGVVMINSAWSIFMYVLTFAFAVASYHESERKSMLFMIPSIVANLVVSPFRTLTLPRLPKGVNRNAGKRKFALRVTLVPVLIVGLFTILYSAGNPVFGNWIGEITNGIGNFIEDLLGNLSFFKFLFLILGFCIGSYALVYGGIKVFGDFDNQLSLKLKRVRSPRPSAFFNKPTDLKKEYLIAMLVFGAMNFLLLLINTIDVWWVWFSFDRSDVVNLSQFVHEGTYVLILSILISIALILFYFRGNLNFYPKNKNLEWLAGLWLFQNFILAISIAVRNWHYISAYNAITYKRVGVFVFLILVVVGLLSVFLKIKHKHTITSVVRTNFLAIFATLSLLSVFNWDGVIARYNLSAAPPQDINYSYIRTMSDGMLPALNAHVEMLQNEKNPENEALIFELERHIQWRLSKSVDEINSRSWLSWNLRDQQLLNLQVDE